MDVRDRIEVALGHWGRFVFRHALAVSVVTLAGVAALASQAPRIQLDTSMEAFLHPNDPTRQTYDRFRADFGRDDQVLIALRAPDLFDPAFLENLRALHRDIEEHVPRVREVTSLINARATRGSDDELIVEDLFEDWPESPEELAVLRERALANPLYRDLILSPDADLTMVLVELDTFATGEAVGELGGFEEAAPAPDADRRFASGEEDSEAVEALTEVLRRHRTPGVEVFMAGAPAMNDRLQKLMRADMVRFTVLAVLSIAVLLGVLFRRLSGVVLPIAIVLLSVVCTVALMALSGVPITPPTQVLPTFLLAVGIGGCVHVLAIFFQRFGEPRHKEEAIAFALQHSGLAVVMTSVTTAGGLSSFAAAELAPISHWGRFGPVGVGVALVLTLVLLPALLALLPVRPVAPAAGGRHRSQRALAAAGAWCTDHAGLVVAVAAALVAVGLLGAAQIRFSFQPMEWFPERDPFRISNELLNRETRGTMFLEVLVDTGEENGLHDPEVLNRIDEMRTYAQGVQLREMFIGKTVSIVDVVKEIHQALNENRPAFYDIPQDRRLVAQELLLFENAGSDDLEDVVDSRFRVARFTMKLPFVDAVQYGPLMELVEGEFSRILGNGTQVTTTGIMALMGRTISAVIVTMARSYVIAFAVITPLMILLIGRIRIGLLSMIPNLTPIVLTLGLMGWVGIPLNPFTLLIGSIALGLAVDDTIHFMHNFRRYYARDGDVRAAVRETLMSTGQALLFTSLVLAAGFFLFTAASMRNLIDFGLLTGFTIVVAFLADVLLAPALMALAFGRRSV